MRRRSGSGRLLTIAWRNVWRNPRRSGVTIAAMTLALLVMVLYTSLLQGYLENLESDITEVEIGDLQIHKPGYLDAPSIYDTIEDPEALLAELEARGYGVAPRLLGGALAAGEETSAGAVIKGVELGRDATASAIFEEVEDGAWLDPRDPRGVVLGRRLALTLNVEPGDELVLLGQATDGSMANDLFTVRGVLGTISEATDRAALFMSAATFRELFGLEQGVHQLLVSRPQELPLEAARVEVEALAPEEETRSWRELLPTLATMLDSASAIMQIMAVVVYLAVAILILDAMLMAVFERIRELGVLKALGMPPHRIFVLMAAEGVLQCAVAVLLGLALSLPGLWYLHRHGLDLMGIGGGSSIAGMTLDSTWYGVVHASTLAGPVIVLAIIVSLAIFFPALKAARIRPLEAMQHR